MTGASRGFRIASGQRGAPRTRAPHRSVARSTPLLIAGLPPRSRYDGVMSDHNRVTIKTRGHTDVIDITAEVSRIVSASRIRDGLVCVFVVGSTASITTTECEPGLMKYDLKSFYDRIAPDDAGYAHEATWGDDNGHAHVRASSLGPSITIPVVAGRMPLGTWQQIVLIDFDTRPRERDVVVQVVGG